MDGANWRSTARPPVGQPVEPQRRQRHWELNGPWSRGNQNALQQRAQPVYRSFGSIQPRDAYKEGVIISTPFHTPDFKNPPEDPNENETLTKIGTWVYSKIRKLIIIQCHDKHCITIPIYTHNNAGLLTKTNRNEYIGVRDSEDPNPPKSESKHENLTATRRLEWQLPGHSSPDGYHFISPRAHAMFTFPFSFSYDWPCQLEAEIVNQDELKRLRSLYYQDRPVEKLVLEDVVDEDGFTAVGRGGQILKAPVGGTKSDSANPA
jgi:hypothetical protein